MYNNLLFTLAALVERKSWQKEHAQAVNAKK